MQSKFGLNVRFIIIWNLFLIHQLWGWWKPVNGLMINLIFTISQAASNFADFLVARRVNQTLRNPTAEEGIRGYQGEDTLL